ncbi:MAG: reverse transcriptase domain-containing protein [bacterium]
MAEERSTGKPRASRKAWSLYGDVCRREVLEAALWQVIANGGGPEVDGVRVEDLAKDGGHRELWLAKLEGDLRGKTYRPSPVRRVYIPKADGKKRPLGIPTVRDRVVQTAVVLLLLPIFEADFHENSFAYPPKRRAQEAIDAIKMALLGGRREVVDTDLSGYFHYANSTQVFGKMPWQMRERVRRWLIFPRKSVEGLFC